MIKQNVIAITIFGLIIAILGRILPHLPNATPLMSLSLLSGVFLTRPKAILATLITLIISDALLAYLNHYPLLGSWTIFTYSGFVCVALMGAYLSFNTPLIGYLVTITLLSIVYWIWTNFGVWLLSGMYPHSFNGFLICYTVALPFLRNALLGDLIWMVTLYLLMQLALHDHLIKREPHPIIVGKAN